MAYSVWAKVELHNVLVKSGFFSRCAGMLILCSKLVWNEVSVVKDLSNVDCILVVGSLASCRVINTQAGMAVKSDRIYHIRMNKVTYKWLMRIIQYIYIWTHPHPESIYALSGISVNWLKPELAGFMTCMSCNQVAHCYNIFNWRTQWSGMHYWTK